MKVWKLVMEVCLNKIFLKNASGNISSLQYYITENLFSNIILHSNIKF